MSDQYTVSGTGHILCNGSVVERQNMRTAQDAVAAILNEQAARISELENWEPVDPYPADMCHVDDKKYVELVPDPTERTGISWHLVGCGWRNAMAEYRRMMDDDR